MHCVVVQMRSKMHVFTVIGALLVTINVATALLLVIVEPEHVIQELHTVTINCTVQDHPGPFDFRWTRASDPEFVLDAPQLVLSQVTVDQAGVYTCNVQTQSSPRNEGSADTNIIVHYAPRWHEDFPAKVAGTVGAPTDVTCVVDAFPVPEFFWQYGGVNLTSSPDYTITSQNNVSTLRIHSLAASNYGEYLCYSGNYVGHRSFPITVQEPGVPDSPRQCVAVNTTDRAAVLHCSPGYAGGDQGSLSFPVLRRQPLLDPVETPSEFYWQDGVVVVTASGLEPLSNYTLLVYQQNSHGRSEENFGVLVWTHDGPAASGGSLSVEQIAIIAGVCGGAVLVAAVVLMVVCFGCRRRGKDKERAPTSTKQKKKDVRNYVMETDEAPPPSRQPSRRGSSKEVRNSFRLRRPLKAASGINNPNYEPDEDGDPRVALDITGPQGVGRGRGQGAYFINLNHKPGETGDDSTYQNAAYVRDLDVSLDSSGRGADVARRREGADPRLRAERQSAEQPGLAGFGALDDLQVPGLGRSGLGPPITPTVRKEVRLSVKAPTFEPEVPWEFPRERLFVRLKVGEGTFGEVWRAKAEGILGRPGMVPVAVKMLKEHYTPEERRSLIKELEIMKLLQPHPNIIDLLGCCTQSEPLCIIMEYASRGNLRDLLRCQRSAFGVNDLSMESPESSRQRDVNLQLRDLKHFGLHVASGMEYIASRELLHRDLAARNILVDENMICKVADFGSARDVIQMRQYESKTQRRLPIRWMAPESLQQCVYTVHSDVWSFGILLWEIVSLGSSPYPGMSGPEVMDYVQKGCRMSKPRHCSNAAYAIMKDCWNHFPPKRPSFNILRHRMIAILDEQTDSLYVDQMGDNAHDIMENMPGEKC